MAGENGNGNGDHAVIIPEVLPGPGRPALWREEFREKIEKLASLGFKKKDIARALGVSYECYRDWQQDRPELIELYEKARLRGGEHFAMRMYEASKDPKFWQSAAWFLERAFPESFSLKQQLVVEHTNAITPAAIEEAEAKLKIM